MSSPSAEDQPANEFEEMVRQAAKDTRVTGLRYSLEQARAGAYALLGAVGIYFGYGVVALISPTLHAVDLEMGTNLRFVGSALSFSAAAAFSIFFSLAKQNPLLYSIVGLSVYAALYVPSMFVMPAGHVWLIQFVLLIALIDGVRAAVQHRRILRRALDETIKEAPPAEL